MSFLYPGFLWGLLLVAIPILIHLFNFKRYKTLYFSSLQFVKHVDQQTKSTKKIKRYLILLARLLAFIFLVFAFAQPFIPSENGEQTKSKLTSIYIDNSFSMQAKGAEGELLSEVREKVKEFIENSDENSLFIIGTNEMSGIEERPLNKAQAYDKVDKIKMSPLVRDLSNIVNWQKEIIRKETPDEGLTKYLLFSDFQISSSQLKLSKESEIEFYPVKIIPESKNNIYIDSVWFSSPIHRENSNCEINIRIKNESEFDIENLELNIEATDVQKTIFVNLASNEYKTTSFTYRDKKATSKKGKVTIADENVNFDDAYYFSYNVQNSANVLLINGDDFIENFKVVFGLDAYFNVEAKLISELTLENFSNKDLVILNGVNEISSGLKSFMLDFSSTGGTTALFPGINPNYANWNTLLASYKLAGLGSKISTGNKIKNIAFKDPFFKGVFEKETQNLNLPSVAHSYQAKGGDGLTLVTLQNGLPLLKSSGINGRAFCFYSSVDSDFGDFANDALFSTILLRIGETSKRSVPLSLTIGEATKFPVYRSKKSEKAMHLVNDRYDVIPNISTVSGVNYLSLSGFSSTDQPQAGQYEIKDDQETIALMSLNFSRDESKLKYLSDEEINSAFNANENNVKLNKLSSEDQFSTIDVDKPFSYWKLCIIFTLIFVLTEMLLVRLIK